MRASVVEMSVVTHIEPEVLTFSTHATLTTSVGTASRALSLEAMIGSGLAHPALMRRN
jgi:NADPH:quinone reductase-like Zn-dependent oxidoreductase